MTECISEFYYGCLLTCQTISAFHNKPYFISLLLIIIIDYKFDFNKIDSKADYFNLETLFSTFSLPIRDIESGSSGP